MSKLVGAEVLAPSCVMILSSLLAASLCSAQPPDSSTSLSCSKGPGPLRCDATRHSDPPTGSAQWAPFAPKNELHRSMRYDRGQPVLKARWEIDLHGAVSAPLTLRPATGGDAESSHGALVGTHSGRVVLLEWNGSHARLAGSWNVNGLVLGPPAWLDEERFVVGTDADSLFAFARGRAEPLWRRQIGRCRHARARGPLGARCDLVHGASWNQGSAQINVATDGLYGLDPQGRSLWQWPRHSALAQPLRAASVSDQEGRIYAGSPSGQAFSLGPQGKLRWSVQLGAGFESQPLLLGDRVCWIARDGQLSCLDRKSGELVWSYHAKSRASGRLWGDSASGRLWASCADGSILSLDAQGKLLWRRKLKGLSPDGIMRRSADEFVAILSGRDTVALAIGSDDGRLRWLGRLSRGKAGQISLVGGRWLVTLRPEGKIQGFWMPPGRRNAPLARRTSKRVKEQWAR